MKNYSFIIFAVFNKYEKSRDENGQEKESVCSSHTGGAGPPLAAPPWCESTPELVSIPVSSCDFISMYNFHLYNPSEYSRSVYRFLVVFCFELFLSGVDLKLGGAPWPLKAMTRAKGLGKVITKTKSGRRSKMLEDQGQETLLLKDQRKLDVSFLMLCRGQHYMFWI
jgi:hypothetical protein